MKYLIQNKYIFFAFYIIIEILLPPNYAFAQNTKDNKRHEAPAPLYVDPMTAGSTDPVLIWNREEKSWWMLYTQRRANVADINDIAYVYGTKIGIASSKDHGHNWVYRGTLDLDVDRGTNTFWAPDVVYQDGVYHMFVVYIKGVHNDWGGKRHIMHYTSQNLWDWNYKDSLKLTSDHVIDPTLIKMPDGNWRMFYKDEERQSHIMSADSKDLTHWKTSTNPVITSQREGPIIFNYKNYYWLLTDEWHGMRIYRSKDAEHWDKQGLILGNKGTKSFDNAHASHGDVVTLNHDSTAYIFYFTQPNGKRPAYVQVGELRVQNGTLIGIRDQFNFWMTDGKNKNYYKPKK